MMIRRPNRLFILDQCMLGEMHISLQKNVIRSSMVSMRNWERTTFHAHCTVVSTSRYSLAKSRQHTSSISRLTTGHISLLVTVAALFHCKTLDIYNTNCVNWNCTKFIKLKWNAIKSCLLFSDHESLYANNNSVDSAQCSGSSWFHGALHALLLNINRVHFLRVIVAFSKDHPK